MSDNTAVGEAGIWDELFLSISSGPHRNLWEGNNIQERLLILLYHEHRYITLTFIQPSGQVFYPDRQIFWKETVLYLKTRFRLLQILKKMWVLLACAMVVRVLLGGVIFGSLDLALQWFYSLLGENCIYIYIYLMFTIVLYFNVSVCVKHNPIIFYVQL